MSHATDKMSSVALHFKVDDCVNVRKISQFLYYSIFIKNDKTKK